MDETLGLYLSVPFCKAKCSFCNFASDVFAPGRMDGYIDRLCAEVRGARAAAKRLGARLPERVDTIYFGGGTPSLLGVEHLERIFAAVRGEFWVDADAEVTLEAAPGQVAGETLGAAMRLGVNRVSFGVQSFMDAESAAVGRSHTGAECIREIERMRAEGVERVSLDLIAGLPHQTGASWRYSLGEAVGSEVDHVSVYLLEVDEDSRLGREALSGGGRYHAGALPTEDETADWYVEACERLGAAGLAQYEISNFARDGFSSRHNLKYWTRKSYLGVGMDAHTMLRVGDGAVRWANPDSMEAYLGRHGGVAGLEVLGAGEVTIDRIGVEAAFEEELFLGLRLNSGVDVVGLAGAFGRARVDRALAVLQEVESAGLVERQASRVRLTASGRLASNEVFSRLLAA